MKLVPHVKQPKQPVPGCNYKVEKSVRFRLIYMKKLLFLSVIQVFT